MLPLQGAQVQSLRGEQRDLRELRSCKLLSLAKKEVREEPEYIGSSLLRKKKICSQPSEHEKITANHKNTHLKLMILVWEDARVWAH